MSLLDKYLSHAKETETGCLEWQRCFNSDGYPRAGNKETQNLKVHREVFFLLHGYYPVVVRHSCDNIKCISPNHLLPGDFTSNMEDRHERNRTYNQIPKEIINQVIELRKTNLTYKQIAKKFNISWKKVDYICHKYS